MAILFPAHYRIIKNEGANWYAVGSKLTNAENKPAGLRDIEQYGLTIEELVTSLFKLNAGRLGYYIANLKDKKYYYCGSTMADVRAKFLDLGIGRRDPLEG